MDKIKISSLGILDEQKFKKLGEAREEWLTSGSDAVINPNTKLSKLTYEMYPRMTNVVIKNILNESDNCKTFVLNEPNGRSLPSFRAGNKVALVVNIDGNFFTRNFTIISPIRDAIKGEYRIAVFKDDKNDAVMDYLFNKSKIGEKCSISAPFGDFYYSDIRDEEKVILIVNEKGIAPALAMAQSICDEIENYQLTVFYSAKKESDLVYRDELIRLADNPSVRVGFVLEEDTDHDDYLTGEVSLDKIKSEYKPDHTSIFISGDEELLEYLATELAPLNLPKKFIRYENFLPEVKNRRTQRYDLYIYINGEKYAVDCYNNKTIMQALEDSGIYIPSRCRNGSCGFCNSELVKGEVKIINDKRNDADKALNLIHPCCTYPLSDIEIVIR
jgi:ferredoxin-NADP reductase